MLPPITLEATLAGASGVPWMGPRGILPWVLPGEKPWVVPWVAPKSTALDHTAKTGRSMQAASLCIRASGYHSKNPYSRSDEW